MDRQASAPVPNPKLVGFRSISLEPGASQRVTFPIAPRELSLITNDAHRVIEPGEFGISVGGKQPGFSRGADASTTRVVTGHFTITGNRIEPEI
jgi:beta-glucosidase